MEFLPSSGCVKYTIWMHHMDTDLVYREEARQELHQNAPSYIENILEVTSHKTAAVQLNHPNKTNKTFGTRLEK